VSTCAFQQDAIVVIDGKPHQLRRKVDKTLWQLEDSRNKRISELTDEQLRLFYVDGKLKFPLAQSGRANPEASQNSARIDYSPEQWERAKVRRAYVLAIIDLPNNRARLKSVVDEVWKKIRQPARAPNPGTVIRWKGLFLRAGRDIVVLMENHDSKGNHRSRYPDMVEEIVHNAISTKYLTLERGTMRDTLDLAQMLTKRENALRPRGDPLPLPTRRLVERLIAAIPAFDRCVARHGRTEAVKRFRTVTGHRTTRGPLVRAEMDHTLANLFVIDDDSFLPLGRPWFTGCLDDHTRNVLGVYISFEPPSYFTVARCLKQALLPKTGLLKQYPAIKNKWDAHGIMRELVVDNGTEFHSASLENACLALDIEIHYSARKTPWFKGKIERFLGTLNRGISRGTPGTTFENVFDREDYDPSKHAVVRYSVLKEIAYTWIVDVYHQQPHRALDMPPAVMWANSIAPEEILVPDDPMRLDAILGKSEVRRLTHKGIELDGLFYNSLSVATLRQRYGEKLDVEVRVDSADLGKIIVFSPDMREMYSVPALRTDYAHSLSAWQHRVCKRYAAQQLKQYSADSWLDAKARIAELIESEFMLKKQKSRTRIARYREEPTRPEDFIAAPEDPFAQSGSVAAEPLSTEAPAGIEPAADSRATPRRITQGAPVRPLESAQPEALPEPQLPAPSLPGSLRPASTTSSGKKFTPVYRERAAHIIEDRVVGRAVVVMDTSEKDE
jgi:putative transposase